MKRLTQNAVNILAMCVLLAAAKPIYARQPIIEERNQVNVESDPKEIYISAQPVVDPTMTTLGIYGQIQKPNEIDLYVFRPLKDDNVPFEILVPSKSSLRNFRPTLFIVGKNLPPATGESYPVLVPLSFEITDILSPTDKRTPEFDFDGLGMYFRGTLRSIPVTANTVYYLIVADPYKRTGTYAIHFGNQSKDTQGLEITAPNVDPETIIFDDSGARNIKEAEGPSTYEKQLFTDRSSPFQNWDGNLSLWSTRIRFILYRLTHLF